MGAVLEATGLGDLSQHTQERGRKKIKANPRQFLAKKDAGKV